MARISSEQAVKQIGNRYDLVLVASQRVRELKHGDRPKINTKHGATLTALKEIEEGRVGRELLNKLREKPRKEIDKYDRY